MELFLFRLKVMWHSVSPGQVNFLLESDKAGLAPSPETKVGWMCLF